ncbi:MAG: SLBB domain-containing protein [Desulfobulbaceae bacterium]|nr:SLBB domain-containing protein [Desulfobulbaceae bacterium]
MSYSTCPNIDCVIIGVNAEKTLGACISSVLACDYNQDKIHIYYVDGGSVDNSVACAARYEKVEIIELHSKHPAPGMGRNRGWKVGGSPLVQFLDSDTMLDKQWLTKGVAAMAPDVGALRGNRLELYPEQSVYNWIGSKEWNGPPGECDGFGGDVLLRREVLLETGGYDEELVGGEDPELSQRVRLQGWKIIQLDETMTFHDLAMTKVSQYWRRAYRTGYGFAAVTDRYVRHKEMVNTFWRTEYRRILVRGGGGLLLLLFGLLGGVFSSLFYSMVVAGLLLIFFPRIFRTSYFMTDKHLECREAKIYAVHCSVVVVPEFFGVIRYWVGSLFGFPLRNKPAGLGSNGGFRRVLSLLLLLPVLLSACGGIDFDETLQRVDKPKQGPDQVVAAPFTTEPRKLRERFANGETVRAMSLDIPIEYLLGPGDVLSLDVWHNQEISNPNLVVGPDGVITVNRIGFVNVNQRTRLNVAEEIKDKLAKLYETPEVSLSIKTYRNNKAYVLGRVANPGVVSFPGRGTLLEALSLAGGLPVLEKQAFLSKCAIIRGKEQIIWVDLKELLQNGNMSLNAGIMNNDVIFIPESEDELIYVLGEVAKPGAFRLKSSITFMDAVMMAGGPTKRANIEKNYIIRSNEGQGVVKNIDMKKMLGAADFSHNYLLRDNDVIYVSERGMSKFNYTLKQIMPFLQVLDLSTSTLERFGVMRELREELWDQEGFVGE